MPARISLEEVLIRLRSLDPELKESVVARLQVDQEIEIAQWGLDKGLRDMSSSVREALQDWIETRRTERKGGLTNASTEALVREIRQRSLVVGNRKALIGLIDVELARLKRNLEAALESAVS